jgi:hypothetical protein
MNSVAPSRIPRITATTNRYRSMTAGVTCGMGRDGCEDPDVHDDPREKREEPFRMGASTSSCVLSRSRLGEVASGVRPP